MRIRERAYIASACLFFAVNNSLAQSYFSAGNDIGQNERFIEVKPASTSLKPGWDIEYLSQPKAGLSTVQAGSKALFASQTQCEVYDFEDDIWSTYSFSHPRRYARGAATQSQACFAGGTTGPSGDATYLKRVDIYSSQTNSWFTSKLSVARITGASAAAGNQILFAGGRNKNGYSDRVDIFREGAKYKTHSLSEARDSMAVAVAGDKIIFAGGETGSIEHPVSTNTVDIYELHSGSWYTAELPMGKQNMAVAAKDYKAVFAGGLVKGANGYSLSNTVDIYNAQTNTWIHTALSEAKYGMATVVAGNKVYFVGGVICLNGSLSNKVEIYDVVNNTWSYTRLPAPRANMAVGQTNDRIMFAGGYINNVGTTTNRIEVLDPNTGMWTVESLSTPRCKIASASYNDKVVFAGGKTGNRYTEPEASGIVDVWTEPSVENQLHYTVSTNNAYQLQNVGTKKKIQIDWIYSDEDNDSFIDADLWKYETRTVKISVLNAYKTTVINKSVIPFGKTIEQIDISQLDNGSYWIKIESEGVKPVVRSVVLNKRKGDGTERILAKL